MLLARLRNPDIAADLLQDVMVESISALRKGQVREPAKLPGFVASVARNVLNSHFRGAARQPESLELPEDLQALKLEADPMEEEQRESRAIEAISSLESVDRSILQMTLVDGLNRSDCYPPGFEPGRRAAAKGCAPRERLSIW